MQKYFLLLFVFQGKSSVQVTCREARCGAGRNVGVKECKGFLKQAVT